MATRKSSSKRTPAKPDTTGVHKTKVLSLDQARPIADAVQALHTIYQLAIMCIDETSHDVDIRGEMLMVAMRDLARTHGRDLDEHIGKISETAGFGWFEPRTGASHG